MRACRTLLGLLLLAPVALAAEIVPFTGEPIKGDFVKLTDKEVVYKVDGKEQRKSIKDVIRVELREPTRPAADKKFSRVELTDGTVLLVEPTWKWKKNDIELTLLSGPKFTLAQSQIASVLNSGENKAHEQDWLRVRLPKNRGKAVVVRPDLDAKTGKPIGDRASNFYVTFGEGDTAGTKITFVVYDEILDTTKKETVDIAGLRGFIFKNTLPPRAPATAVKLLDASGNRVMVSSLTPTDKGVTVATPAGVKIEYTYEQLATLDYAPGRFEYLVEMAEEKRAVKGSSNLADKAESLRYKEQAVTVAGTTTKRGQVFFPQVEVTYDLDGNFQRFQAYVGENTKAGEIDGKVTRLTDAVTMVIEGDGRELASVTLSAKDKVRHKDLNINVKDVQKLKITVKVVKGFDTGTSLALAEARVIK